MKNLIHEIHRRSLWQVLSIYVVGGWIALQAVDLLQATLRLPEWTPSFALVLLVVGLPIVLATAFVQEGIGSKGPAQDLPADEQVSAEAEQEGSEPAPAPAVHHRVFTWRNLIFGAAGAFLVLFGFAGVYVVLQDRGRSFAPTEATAVEPDPGIAFLPFEVSGPELENLREGMVTLLFTTLDGVAGLRAIDSRTVLAKWDQQVGPGVRADLETLLSVARATDARYAFVGSAVDLGARLRLSGDIYDLPAGASLDRVQAQGSPDSLQAIVDDLAIETLRVLGRAGVEVVPRADLVGVTTHSLPALTAYLEGESYFRRGEFEAAFYAYKRALSADSTFALAHYRIANVLSWKGGVPGAAAIGNKADEADHLAAALAGNLPPSKQLYARAQSTQLYSGSELLAIEDELRATVRRQPDDAEAWWVLGDLLYHTHQAGAPSETRKEARQALRHATELDPGFAIYAFHLIDMAFADDDASEAAKWVEAFGRASPGSTADRTYRIMYRLVFEPAVDSDAFEAAVDTLADLRQPGEYVVFNPRAARVAESILLRYAERTGDLSQGICWRWGLTEGQWSQFLGYATDERLTPGERLVCLYQAHMRDFPVPGDLLEEAIVLALEAEEAEGASRRADYAPVWAGALAASEGRWSDYEAMRALLQDRLEEARRSGDSGTKYQVWLRFLEAHSLWQRGELERAAEVLENLPQFYKWPPVLWWLGNINLELGRPEAAADYFLAVRLWSGGMAWTRAFFYLGVAYEQMGNLEKARQAYADYLDAWKDADPELQPLVEQGREALARLGPLDQ